MKSQKDDDNGVFPESVSEHIILGKLKSLQSIQGVLAERMSEKKDSEVGGTSTGRNVNGIYI